jgi:hypothetical protein
MVQQRFLKRGHIFEGTPFIFMSKKYNFGSMFDSLTFLPT